MIRSTRTRSAVLLTALATAHLGGVGLGVAAAHDGDGVLVVESQGPANDRSVPYVVRLTWENDGHAAIDATVTATAVAADGTPQTPVPMEAIDEDGRYSATLTYPSSGRWTVRFTSVTPTATAEVAEEVAPATTTTPTTIDSDSTTTSIGAVTATTEQAAPGDPDDGRGIGAGGVLAAVFLGLVVIGCAVGFARSSRRLRADR